MNNEYKIATLADIADIPEDALPRFIAELPTMLGYVRMMKAAAKMTSQATGVELELEIPSPTWIDDGEEFHRVTVSVLGSDRVTLIDTFPEVAS